VRCRSGGPAALLVALLLPQPAVADPFAWHPVVDTSATVSAFVLWVSMESLVDPNCAAPLPCQQDPSRCGHPDITAIDRLTPESWSPAMDPVSDGLVYATLAGSLAAAGLAGGDPADRAGDVGLVAESVAVSGFVVAVVKHAVDRPRPYTWLADPPDDVLDELGTVDAHLSFPSSHTATTASASFAAASVLVAHGARPLPVYGAAALLTVAVGGLRVAAGRHYPSDVLAGAATGVAVGLSMPALHRRSP
jgi:membrane-associated phospholipid phosphatase